MIIIRVTRKPGMTRDDIFTLNAGIIRKAAENIAKYTLIMLLINLYIRANIFLLKNKSAKKK
jgi:malate/lactate dehydrogenase